MKQRLLYVTLDMTPGKCHITLTPKGALALTQSMKSKFKKVSVTVVAVAIVAVTLFYTNQWAENRNSVTYEAPKIFSVTPPKSDVELAKEMLAEATAKLDAEEALIEAEIKRIQDEATVKVAELEAKITEINNIRSSF